MDRAKDTAPVPDLKTCLSLWNRGFAAKLLTLAALAVLISAITYLANGALQSLTLSLGQKALAAQAGAATLAARVAHAVDSLRAAAGLSPVAGFLVFFSALSLLSPVVGRVIDYLADALRIESVNAAEIAVTQHLLRKDEYFYSAHPIGEISNRLAIDVPRAAAARVTAMRGFSAAAVLFGNLYFFWEQDRALAAVALILSLATIGLMLSISRGVVELDHDYLGKEDALRSQTEDYIRIAPEVQVYGQFERVAASLRALGAIRNRSYIRRMRWENRFYFTKAAGSVAALLLMIVAAYELRRPGATGEAATIAIVPVIVWALPRLYESAFEVAATAIRIKAATASSRRLLEYDSSGDDRGHGAMPRPAPTAPTVAAVPPADGRAFRVARIWLDRVSYRHPGGHGGGGIAEADLSFQLGEWTALVGRAGAGKSTLIGLILGRWEPQSGTLRCETADGALLPGRRIDAFASYLPQRFHLLDTTILANLQLSRSAQDTGETDSVLGPDDEATIEAIGVGRLCRQKALDLVPEIDATAARAGCDLVGLRQEIRRLLPGKIAESIPPLDSGAPAPDRLAIEALLRGKCQVEAAFAVLQTRPGRKVLRPFLIGRFGRAAVAAPCSLLAENARLLAIDRYETYSSLSPRPLPQPAWALLRDIAGHGGAGRTNPGSDLALLTAALFFPCGDGQETWSLLPHIVSAQRECAVAIDALKTCLGRHFRPFDPAAIHPWLTWRENLIFGSAASLAAASQAAIERVVLEAIESGPARRFFTDQGLRYAVGRNGSRLSGGQGQLIALGRALLRRGHVVVLDEPTSALDPRSRAAVLEHLRQMSKERILITVTHDTEAMRQADRVVFLSEGRIADIGRFEELQARSAEFAAVVKG